MARDPQLTGLRRVLLTRRNGWTLAAVLALLGILLGAHQLSRAADLAGQALGDATRLAPGWRAAWPLAANAARLLPAGCDHG